MNEATVAKAIKSRFTTLHSNQIEIFDDVERYKAMYRCEMEPDESYPWEYQLSDPQIFPTVRAHLARMNPQEARISLIGQGEFREVNQQLINWELNEILITQLMYKLMYSGFLAGRGYIKTGWFYKPALKIKTDRGEKIIRSIQNRADAVYVRFNDLFIPNRNIPELDAQPYIIERISMRYGDLLDDQEATGRWKQDLIQKIADKKQFTNTIDYGVDLINEETSKENTLLRSQNVSMLCMTTIDGEEYYTLENGQDEILNKDMENRYWHGHYPYIDFAPFPEDDEFFSMGIPKTIADLEVALSSSLNQIMTNGRKAGNSMWMVGDSAKQVPDWMFTDRPNGVVRVKGNLQDYQRLTNDNQSMSQMLELRRELKTAVESTSGISSLYASGVASAPQVNKTAKGAEIIDGNIDQNLQLLISLYGAQVLKKMGEHFMELNTQFITEDQTFDITGKRGKYEFVTAKPDQIGANFKVKASPERLLRSSPAVKLASLQNTISTLESQKSVKVDMQPLYEELIGETPGLEDIDPESIVIDPEKKANEVIKSVMGGYEPPEATYDDDHKAMLAIIQKHLIDMDHPEEQLAIFVSYLEQLRRWIEAKNPQLTAPPKPQLQPMNEQSLIESMSASGGGNPTADMAVPIPQDQLGV